MESRTLGHHGPAVSAIGFGAMSIGIADIYTSSVHDDAAGVALLHRALDLGITLLDTADIYGNSEDLVGKALKGRREGVVLATKFGFVGDAIDGSPHEASVFQIAFKKSEVRVCLQRCDMLDLPAAEIVRDHHLRAARKQLRRKVRPDAAGAACD